MSRRTYQDPKGFREWWRGKINTALVHVDEASFERLFACEAWEFQLEKIRKLEDENKVLRESRKQSVNKIYNIGFSN